MINLEIFYHITLNILAPIIFYLILISQMLGCGVQVGDENSDNQIDTHIITGSYNTNTTTCDFTSEKTFDGENIDGCIFTQECTGDVRTSDFIPFHDKDFHSKCINPVEELPEEVSEEDQALQDAKDALNDGVL